jgi:hypothetical protein
MTAPKEMLPSNDLDVELLFALAERKAEGVSWTAVANEFNKPVAELKRITRQHADVWDTCFDQAQKEVINEARAEAIRAMRRALRSDKAHETVQATNSLVRLWDTLNPKNQPRNSQAQPELAVPPKAKVEQARFHQPPRSVPLGFLLAFILGMMLPRALDMVRTGSAPAGEASAVACAPIPTEPAKDVSARAGAPTLTVQLAEASPVAGAPVPTALTAFASAVAVIPVGTAHQQASAPPDRDYVNALFFRGMAPIVLSG